MEREQEGLSRATLRNSRASEWCSCVTLRSCEGGEGNGGGLGCPRSRTNGTMDSTRCLNGSITQRDWLLYTDDMVENGSGMLWTTWAGLVGCFLMNMTCAWLLVACLYELLKGNNGLTRERAVCGVTQDGGNWVTRLPGEFMHSRRLNFNLGERGEVALDSDDDSEAETSKIHNESTSEDLD